MNRKEQPYPVDIYDQLKSIVAGDSAGRGVPRLCTSAMFSESLELLERSRKPLIITGFVVPPLGVAETDGPSGAAVLARALKERGKNVGLATDRACEPVLRAAADVLGYEEELLVEEFGEALFNAFSPDLVVFVERLGRGADGRYYNMRCEEIGAWTAPLDEALLAAKEVHVPSLAVGDGGNEAGMGLFHEELRRLVPDFASCLCVLSATVTLPVDVSNWGCYALSGLLSLSPSHWLGIREGEEEALLHAMIAAGAVDGATKKREYTVDGMSLERQNEVARKIFGVLHERNE